MKKISEFMKADHKYINHLLVDFLSEEDFDVATKKFHRFENRLVKHINLEEDVLLPIFNKHLVLEKDKGPAMIIHRDHEGIFKLIERIKKHIELKDHKKVMETGYHLKMAIFEHLKREDETQYSLFDNFIIVPTKDWSDVLVKTYKAKKNRDRKKIKVVA